MHILKKGTCDIWKVKECGLHLYTTELYMKCQSETTDVNLEINFATKSLQSLVTTARRQMILPLIPIQALKGSQNKQRCKFVSQLSKLILPHKISVLKTLPSQDVQHPGDHREGPPGAALRYHI